MRRANSDTSNSHSARSAAANSGKRMRVPQPKGVNAGGSLWGNSSFKHAAG